MTRSDVKQLQRILDSSDVRASLQSLLAKQVRRAPVKAMKRERLAKEKQQQLSDGPGLRCLGLHAAHAAHALSGGQAMTEKRAYAVARLSELGLIVDLSNTTFAPGDEVEIRPRGEEDEHEPTQGEFELAMREAAHGWADHAEQAHSDCIECERWAERVADPEKPSEIRPRVAPGEHVMSAADERGAAAGVVYELLPFLYSSGDDPDRDGKRGVCNDCGFNAVMDEHGQWICEHTPEDTGCAIGNAERFVRAVDAEQIAAALEGQEAPPKTLLHGTRIESRADLETALAEAAQEAPRGVFRPDAQRPPPSFDYPRGSLSDDGQEVPSALPPQVICENWLHPRVPHDQQHWCNNPRPAHPPAARTEQEKRLGEEVFLATPEEREEGRGPWRWLVAVPGAFEHYRGHLFDGRGYARCGEGIPGQIDKPAPGRVWNKCRDCVATLPAGPVSAAPVDGDSTPCPVCREPMGLHNRVFGGCVLTRPAAAPVDPALTCLVPIYKKSHGWYEDACGAPLPCPLHSAPRVEPEKLGEEKP